VRLDHATSPVQVQPGVTSRTRIPTMHARVQTARQDQRSDRAVRPKQRRNRQPECAQHSSTPTSKTKKKPKNNRKHKNHKNNEHQQQPWPATTAEKAIQIRIPTREFPAEPPDRVHIDSTQSKRRREERVRSVRSARQRKAEAMVSRHQQRSTVGGVERHKELVTPRTTTPRRTAQRQWTSSRTPGPGTSGS